MKTIFAFLLFFCSFSVYAQNEDGIRDRLPRGGFTQGYLSFHRLFPIIRSIPPIDSSMPPDLQMAYFYLDSLLKRKGDSITGRNYKTIIESLHWSSDTIRQAWKWLYLLEEYDPLRFAQYNRETYINQNKKYKHLLENVKAHLASKAKEMPDSLRLKIVSLLRPMYVLKVEIVSLDSLPANKDFNVKCRLLDTLKGRVIPLFTEQNYLQNMTNSPEYFFSVSYSEHTVQQVYEYSSGPNLFPNLEPYHFDWNKFMMRMIPGDTAIVFLFEGNAMSTLTDDYIFIRINPFAGNGAMPVQNGMVKDINTIFSDQELTPYQEWKERFLHYKNYIIGY